MLLGGGGATLCASFLRAVNGKGIGIKGFLLVTLCATFLLLTDGDGIGVKGLLLVTAVVTVMLMSELGEIKAFGGGLTGFSFTLVSFGSSVTFPLSSGGALIFCTQ